MHGRRVNRIIEEKRAIRASIHEIRKFMGRDLPDREYDKFLYRNAYNVAGTLQKLKKEFRGRYFDAEIDLIYAYALEKKFHEASKPGDQSIGLPLVPFLAKRGVLAYLKKFKKFSDANEQDISQAMRRVVNEFSVHHRQKVEPRGKFHEYLHKYYIHYLETRNHRTNIIYFAQLSTVKYFMDEFAKAKLGPLLEPIAR